MRNWIPGISGVDDEFWGGTSAGGVTGDVTGSELAEVCQKSYVSVTGCNIT